MIREFLLLASVGLAHPIPVDFKLQVAPSTASPGPIQLVPEPTATPDPVTTAPIRSDDMEEVPLRRLNHVSRPTPAIPVVKGFGKQIPLDFAVRQIVPGKLHVVYADGVDREEVVSWHGGQSWQLTLRSVVVPLGMHVSMSADTIRITR